MSEIQFSVGTDRTIEQIKTVIEAEINNRLPGQRIKRFWEGDVYRLVGMGADASIQVSNGQIHAQAQLRPPLSLMKSKVEQNLRETIELAARGDGSNGSAASAQSGVIVPPPTGGSSKEIEALRRRVRGLVLDGPTAMSEFHNNFGRIHTWVPRYVVRPVCEEDVLAAIDFARERNLNIATRGAAHSQSELAISRDGILLDMKTMSRVLSLDEQAQSVTLEPGVIWRDLVAYTHNRGLVPPVLTNNLSVTVGGTLSIAGVGVASFKYGIQGDQVLSMKIATMDGELRTCTREQNSDLFWGVLAGLGQIGVITEVTMKLRRPKAMVRSYYLIYDDIDRFMEDSVTAMDCGKWDHLESWSAPCAQGLKTVGSERQVFAKWFFPFHMTVEYDPDSPPDDEKMLEGLNPYDKVHVEDLPIHEFLNRMIPVFEIWKMLGTWEHKHPWMEVVLPWDKAAEYIKTVLADLPPGVAVGGHVLLWPAKRDASKVPLFKHPDTEYLVGFGILPAVPDKLWDKVKKNLKAASDLSTAMGGKRYLSGYVEFDQQQWRDHFGENWGELCALKKKYDPDNRLNPGFVPFE